MSEDIKILWRSACDRLDAADEIITQIKEQQALLEKQLYKAVDIRRKTIMQIERLKALME